MQDENCKYCEKHVKQGIVLFDEGSKLVHPSCFNANYDTPSQFNMQVWQEHRHSHYVCVRVWLPSEAPARFFDAQITDVVGDVMTVSAVVVNVGTREFTVPTTNVMQMYVGTSFVTQ